MSQPTSIIVECASACLSGAALADLPIIERGLLPGDFTIHPAANSLSDLVIAQGDGSFLLAWTDLRQANNNDQNGFVMPVSPSNAGGSEHCVTTGTRNQRNSEIAIGPGGTLAVAYVSSDGVTYATTTRFTTTSGFDTYRVGLSLLGATPCDSIDFNNDTLFPDTLDVDDFISVFSGGPCSTGNCNDTDFNNDGLFPDTADLDALLRVFSGGNC